MTSSNWRLFGYIGGAMLLTLLLVVGISSCNQRPAYGPAYPAPVVGTAPAPVVIGGAPTVVHSGGGHNDMLLGGALGYMLGRSNNQQSTHTTTVVQQAPVTTTAPAQRYGQSTYSTPPSRPTFQSSSTVNTRGVSTTTTSRSTSFGSRRR